MASSTPPEPTGLVMLRFYTFLQYQLSRVTRGDDRGVTAVEYAILGIFITVVIAGAVTLLGTTLRGMYQAVANAIGGG
jgi:pilus assembly protein Flp/PilA